MPKRMISDALWKSKKLRNIHPPELRPEYAWILPVANDHGVFEYDAEKLWADAYAVARPGWTVAQVEALLEELIRAGLLLKYEAEGKSWCYFVGSDKPGHLPKPSERYSKDPLPPLAEPQSVVSGSGAAKARPTSAPSAVNPREVATGFGAGLGVGLGIGSGKGTGTGTATGEQVTETTQTATVNSSVSLLFETTQETNTRTKTAASPDLSPEERMAKRSNGTQIGPFSLPVREDDPLLRLLAKMIEEAAKVAVTEPASVPAPDWDGKDPTKATFIEVMPGDARYPSLDDSRWEGAPTRREVCALQVWTQFNMAMQMLRGLVQHLPYLQKAHVAEGEIEFSEETIRNMMTHFFGFPNGIQSGYDTSPAYFWAATNWAFLKSDYWPKRLGTLTDVIGSWQTYSAQYAKFYKSVPDDKKPHRLGVGKPKLSAEEAEELWRAWQLDGTTTANIEQPKKNEEDSLRDDPVLPDHDDGEGL